MEKDNIVLIGMPGCGKSTAGVILAKAAGYDFIDTDLLIQKQEKARLAEIIQREGNERFLQIESNVISNLEATRTVIATGGSAVYSKSAMDHLKQNGLVIYLQVSLPELKIRLKDLKARGVVLPEHTTLEELYAERTALYRKYADITVDEGGEGPESTVRKILSETGGNSSFHS